MSIRIRSVPSFVVVLAAASGLGLAPSLLAATLTLIPSADTSLFELTPGNNMGSVQSVAVGVTGHGTLARALMKFNLGAIPENATVTDARLTIPVIKEPLAVEEATFDLHRVLVDWSEGNKGAGVLTGTGVAATAGEATWAARSHPLTTWGAGGGAAEQDYAGTPTASAEVGASVGFSGAAVVSDVQGWVSNPGSNFGWLIKDSVEAVTSQTARRLVSRELPVAQPQLVVTYSETPLLRIVDLTRLGNQLCFKFAPAPGKTYSVERRSVVDSGDWSAFQFFPAGDGREPFTVCDLISAGPSFYRVVEQ